ncbi:hypothetical protein MTR67_001873 [Solanum verrucosum]|uniref:Integrase zinc-binding domain-containing protein n=1 Tax=Solanum verrucosum TaxID=315347 RepID=A0AAF0PNX9_SOLVR|nr:hypothetical protein MTR67_001873 [Solanum verrucosum]
MNRELWGVYWWNGMKNNIAEFVAKCPNCQQVKVEYQKPRGMTQDISFPTWKWEDLNMDFVTAEEYARLYIGKLVKLHGVPLSSILDKELASVHLVFHVSILMKHIGDPITDVPLESVGVKDSLSYKECPVEILDH